jgi:hypothetical protein|tara:strand:+ start:1672 stop:2085 length:414 start_codon:yes stop_codon:yes gene_type:complete
MDTDKEIFAGKTFASLAKDIYFNSSRKSAQIDQLIKDLRQMIKDAGSATVIAPMIKDYIDVSIKNDDQLVKLSAVLQRYLSGGAGGDPSADGAGSGLTDSEKEELLNSVKLEVDELKKAESEIIVDLDSLQKKKSNK